MVSYDHFEGYSSKLAQLFAPDLSTDATFLFCGLIEAWTLPFNYDADGCS